MPTAAEPTVTTALRAEPAPAVVAHPAGRAPGWKRYLPALTIGAVGLLLAGAYFPRLYDHVTGYDDEGALVATMRRFLHHGSLYDHTHGSYGPFYYSLNGAIFRLTGQSPTPFTARILVLVFTALSVMLFGAAVWRVTRSVTTSVLCEVATFIVVIQVAGLQPLHPGSLIVLLLAVMSYCLASWVMTRRTRYLAVVGIATGGLLMTKINVGLFAVGALAVAFVIGNRHYPRWFRIAVGASVVILPFAVASQLIWQGLTAEFVVVVAFSMLACYVPLDADTITIPPRTLLVIGEAIGATIVISCIWPLLSGSAPTRVFFGVFVQPLGQTDHLTIPVHTDFAWLPIVVTLVGLFAVIARRQGRLWVDRRPVWLTAAALPITGLIVLGLGLYGGPAAWLPAIVLLPAIAWLADYPRKVRLALRFLVPLAILQMMHAYPVAGSQRAWGLVTMCVPCAIAVGAGLQRLAPWRSTTVWTRAIAVGALCALIAVTAGEWPLKTWHDYVKATPLDLPGARLIRIDESVATTLQRLTKVVRKNCDTFYSTPGFDILYFYTQLPEPTGQLANWPGVLSVREQRDIAYQLRALERKHRRVCIVRDDKTYSRWQKSSYAKEPLGRAVAPFQRKVAQVDHYTVLKYGRASRAKPHGSGKQKVTRQARAGG
jgi:hypothetical protein